MISNKRLKQVLLVFQKNDSDKAKTASELGIGLESLSRYLRTAKNQGKKANTEGNKGTDTSCSREFKGDTGIITTKSLNIKTVEEAMSYAQVDTDVWEPYRSKINSWEVTMGQDKTATGHPETYTNWQVTVFLQRKPTNLHKTAIEELIEKIPTLSFPIKSEELETSGKAIELCPFDVHLGKMAWGIETGEQDYDLKIARGHFIDATLENLEYARWHKPSKIYYILGQDLLHVENFIPQTSKGGNVLDVDSRFPKILAQAQSVTIEVLYECIRVAPTEVLWVPGNHDINASLFISEIVKQHFRNEPRLEVDNSPKQKKARLWGNLLVGWTHDANKRQANLVNILPQFFPKLWGLSQFREWHTGHKHKKDEWKFMPVLTEGGTIIRQIPTLSQIDAWHVENDFVSAVPATESFVWTLDKGICAHYTANITKEKQGE